MASGPAAVPDEFTGALGARRTRLGLLGTRAVYFETTSSTNDVADRLAADGAPHGTIVFADAQESGRGRLGRTWFSPPGAGLYISVVLRPENLSNPAKAGFHEDAPDPRNVGAGFRDVGAGFSRPLSPRDVASGFSRTTGVAFASGVSLTAGVAIAEGIRAACGLAVAIKWPNDLVVDRRKLCGILAEASSRAGDLQHVILGYGINVRPAAYPPDIADRATALETELGREVDRATVLAETLASLAEWLERARLEPCASNAGGFAGMLARWRELSPSSVGAPVEVLRPGDRWVTATTAGVDDDGALLVTIGGQTERVVAGEVRWI